MSARPHIPRLEGEELDLLISRALDGDLSPEEARDLETVLANDPAARKRQEDLAGLVAEARALPEPAPPFALSTRVNSNVSEKTARGGSIFHRFGFYPPPGFAIGAMVVLGFVAIGITLMNPAPKRAASTIAAQRADGPVEVFFQEGARAKAKVTANDALKDVAKKAAPAQPESVAARIASKDEARDGGAAALSTSAAGRSEAPASVLESKQAASVVASNEPVLDEKQNKLAKSEVASEADADASRKVVVTANAPVLSAPAPQAAGAIAQAAPQPAAPAPAAKVAVARASQPAPAHTWNVAIRGDGARRWMLRRAPEGRPTAATAAAAAFRITLDAEGRVTTVRPLDAHAVQPALLAFVRGLVFAPVGDAASSVGVATTYSYRDREQKAKDERGDAAGAKADAVAVNPAEIEVEVSAH